MGFVLVLLAGVFGLIALYCYDASWEIQGYEDHHWSDVWTYRVYATCALAAAFLFGNAYQQLNLERTIQRLNEATEATVRL